MTCAFITALLAAGSVPAQEEAEDSSRAESGGRSILVEASVWVAQTTGLDYTPTTEFDRIEPFRSNLLRLPTGTEARGRYKLAYAFPGRVGEFGITYYSHEETPAFAVERPGEFVFGETLVHPLNAGVFDDGLADRVEAATVTRLRDFRIDYYRPAFRNERASAKWFVGWRRVFHSREIEADYFALAADLPPILPPVSNPRPDLEPFTDTAFQESRYEGRGPEAGMDFLVSLWEDRILLEAGFALAVLRGNFETSYTSTTAVYVVDDGVGNLIPLAPPYDEFNDPDLIGGVVQLLLPIGLDSNRVPGDAMALDAYVGVRWRFWKQLEFVGGFRASRYDDVALDMRPKEVSYGLNGVLNIQDVDRRVESVGYEGFYGGFAYRF